MSHPRRRRFADYLPEDVRDEEIAAASPIGAPRPGHGTIWVHKGHDDSRERGVVWIADWIDEDPAPRDDGATSGVETFQGTREAVLTWARSRPAATRLMPSEDEGWIPLPPNDQDVPL